MGTERGIESLSSKTTVSLVAPARHLCLLISCKPKVQRVLSRRTALIESPLGGPKLSCSRSSPALAIPTPTPLGRAGSPAPTHVAKRVPAAPGREEEAGFLRPRSPIQQARGAPHTPGWALRSRHRRRRLRRAQRGGGGPGASLGPRVGSPLAPAPSLRRPRFPQRLREGPDPLRGPAPQKAPLLSAPERPWPPAAGSPPRPSAPAPPGTAGPARPWRALPPAPCTDPPLAGHRPHAPT